MRARDVIIRGITPQDAHQMRLVARNQVVETLAPDRADQEIHGCNAVRVVEQKILPALRWAESPIGLLNSRSQRVR